MEIRNEIIDELDRRFDVLMDDKITHSESIYVHSLMRLAMELDLSNLVTTEEFDSNLYTPYIRTLFATINDKFNMDNLGE